MHAANMKDEFKTILRDAIEWVVVSTLLILFLVAIGRGPWTRSAEPLALMWPLFVALRSYRRFKAAKSEPASQ